MLAASEAYFDLLLASGLLAIEREAAANARSLAEITASYARSGAGLEADHQRILTELDHRRGNIEDAVGRLEVASANLVNLLVLDPNQVLAPVEPAEAVFRLLPDETPLDDLIVQGLHQRPELASAQELVQATLLRLKQARLRPLIPSLAFSYAGGGFGGGQNGFFGNFGTRGDATVSLYWELQNLGFADVAIARRSQAENRAAALRLIKVENQVAADVTTAYKSRLAASHRMAQAAPAVTKGLESLRLNMLNIRRGAGLPAATRPIEVLQPIQALAQARTDYLNAVLAYNRANSGSIGRSDGPRSHPYRRSQPTPLREPCQLRLPMVGSRSQLPPTPTRRGLALIGAGHDEAHIGVVQNDTLLPHDILEHFPPELQERESRLGEVGDLLHELRPAE